MRKRTTSPFRHPSKYHINLLISCLFILLTISSNNLSAQSRYNKLCLSGFSSENNGNLEEAIKQYSAAIALNPAKGDAYSFRANTLLKRESYQEAIADASKAISLNPSSMVLYHLRGNCYFESNNFEKAIADYSKMLSKGKSESYSEIYPYQEDKKNFSIYFKRAKALYHTNRYQQAIQDISHAISMATSIKAQTDYMYNWRAKCNIGLGNYGEAIKDYEICIPSFPNDLNINFYLGLAHYKSGNLEKARHYALKIKELDLSNERNFTGEKLLSIFDLGTRRSMASQYYANAKRKIDEFAHVTSGYFLALKASDAFQYLDSAWFVAPNLDPDDFKLKDSIIEAYFVVYPKLKEKPEIPEIARKYIVQATNASEEKKYTESIDLWNKALSITPYNPLAFYNCALIREFLGQYDRAILNMKKYIQLSPDAEDARGAQDKIYLWESKTKNQSTSFSYTFDPELTAKLQSKAKESRGVYHVAFAFGGGIGLNTGDNSSLGNYWDNLDGHGSSNSVSDKYGSNLRLAYSGDFDLILRPAPRFAMGFFERAQGGIGSSATISKGESHTLSMTSLQMGGLARLFLMVNNMNDKLDLYLQFKYGINMLEGSYRKTSNYLVNYSKKLTGSAPTMGIAFGFGGKAGKVSYITMELEYYNSLIDVINYKTTVNDADPATIGNSGTLRNVSASYSGIMLKLMLLGFCF